MRFLGVHKKNKSGKYDFDSAEEASQAYQSKKLEVNAMQKQCTNKHTHSELEKAGGSEIDVPISNSCNVGTDPRIDDSHGIGTAEEGFRVDQCNEKQVFLDTGKEASKDLKSCLMANVCGTNNTIGRNAKARRSLTGIKRRKSGRYAAVITDPIKHKKVCLGTFDTMEEASQAYLSKKSEFEKLRQQGNEENKPKENCDQIQQPELPSVMASFFMANDQILDTASESLGDKRIDSHKTKPPIIGAYKSKTKGRYTSEITNPITKKKIWLGTFDTAEEASHAFQSKKLEFQKLVKAKQQQCTNKHTHSKPDAGEEKNLVNVKQGHETLNGHERFHPESAYQSKEKQEFSCLMANARGKESSDECNITTSFHPKAKRSFVGIKRQTNGRYAAVITDRVKHRKVWFGTFDTIEEASQAYFSKKSELEKLSQLGQTENIPKKNCDQIQQPESPVVETLNAASMGRRNIRIDSQGKEPGSSKAASCLMTNVRGAESSDECNNTTSCNPKAKISLIGIRWQKSGRYQAVITDPIKLKEVSLGTFGTVKEASQAYLSKKSEFEKLRQQGNEENKPKKNCDQIQQPESPSVGASLDTAASASGRDKRIDYQKPSPHTIGARKSKTKGRYTSQITNPITRKKIWLGTFDTAEEASQAYLSKKLEFQKLVKAKQQQGTQRKSEKLVNVKQGHENVNCELKSSDESAELDVPFSNSSDGGTVQSIDSLKIGAAEEAFHDHQSKKFDLHSSKEVEQKSNMLTDSSSGEKQEGQEDDEDLWMGKWMQLPGDDRAVMFSPKLGLPIIDNYGYLLGEFSSLDDLSICVTKDDNQM